MAFQIQETYLFMEACKTGSLSFEYDNFTYAYLISNLTKLKPIRYP